MASTRHIPILLACLATTGVAGAWAQDQSAQNPAAYNPWRMPPRTPPPGSTAEDERGYTQGYLRGFEQGYRRGAEQATGSAPTANLGPPSTTGSTGSVTSGSVLSDSAPAGIVTPRNPAQPPAPAAATDDGQGPRQFNAKSSPKSSQWGDYPPLDGDRPATSRPDASSARPPVAAYAPAYPYSSLPPQPQPYAQGAYAPGYAQPYPPPGYGQPYAQPYATAPYGYGSPFAGGPSTLGGPFGMSPIPGMPGFGGPGFGAW